MPIEETPVIEETPIVEETPPLETIEPNLDQEILNELKTINQNTNDSFAEDKLFNQNFETFKTELGESNESFQEEITALNETNDYLLGEIQIMNENINNLKHSNEYQVGQSHIAITVALTVAFCYVLYRVLKYFTY